MEYVKKIFQIPVDIFCFSIRVQCNQPQNMNIRIIRFSTPSRLLRAAQICLSNRLYVDGWSFQSWLSNIDNYRVSDIFIMYDNNSPIGCFIKRDIPWSPNCGIYIKNSYRLQGLGKMLYRTAEEKYPNSLHNGYGITGSSTFFRKASTIV